METATSMRTGSDFEEEGTVVVVLTGAEERNNINSKPTT